LFYDQLGEIVVVDAGHIDVGVAIPATGYGLGGKAAMEDEEGTYIE
jgi:hypothetical protein